MNTDAYVAELQRRKPHAPQAVGLFGWFRTTFQRTWDGGVADVDAWQSQLANFHPAAMRHACQCVKRDASDYPPSLTKFIGYCRQWVATEAAKQDQLAALAASKVADTKAMPFALLKRGQSELQEVAGKLHRKIHRADQAEDYTEVERLRGELDALELPGYVPRTVADLALWRTGQWNEVSGGRRADQRGGVASA